MNMNLNPFIFSYKNYPDCKLATFVNGICSGVQRICIIFATIITLVVVFDSVSNWGEALCAAAVMFLLWLLLKFKKDSWSDKIAEKQAAIDNSENNEEL